MTLTMNMQIVQEKPPPHLRNVIVDSQAPYFDLQIDTGIDLVSLLRIMLTLEYFKGLIIR